MKSYWTVFILLLTCGCAPVVSPLYLYSSESLSRSVSPFLEDQDIQGLQDHTLNYLFDRASCSNFNNQVWNHIYITLFNNSPPPPPPLIQRKVRNYAQDYLTIKGGKARMVRRFSQKFAELYELAFQFFADKTEETILSQLTDIDYLGDMSNNADDDSVDQNVIQFSQSAALIFDELRRLILPLNLPCVEGGGGGFSSGSPNMESSFLLNMRNKLHPIVYGARKVMATAYQSCKVLRMPLVPARYSGVRGISQRARPGNYYVRNISSLRQVQDSHYYLTNRQNPHQCLDVSRNPLIFDYGGKPLVRQHPYPVIDLFQNAGSGSRVLGIDCSGFVLSALAGGGLRVQKHKPIRGLQISGISSWDFKRPSNRLNCFRRVNSSYTQPVLPGDVVAVMGHVLIVDQISDDPLGLSKMKSVSQCPVSQVSSQQWNFSIIQSSAVFNGIGINRIHIRDMDHPQLTAGLKKLTSQLCYNKFRNSIPRSNTNITILRHSLSSECRDFEVYLEGQECLSSCTSA